MNSARHHERLDRNIHRLGYALGFMALITLMVARLANAQVPPDIEAKLLKIGPIVDPACTAKIYRPMMPRQEVADQYLEMEKTGKPSNQVPLYPGITIERDVSFGSDPKDVVDIFHAEKGPATRTVLIFVPGGPGNKIELQDKEANAFYDNLMRWATQSGMVGVAMQRHGVAPSEHIQVPRKSQSHFHLGALGGKWSTWNLRRTSRVVWSQGHRSNGCRLHVRPVQHFSP
jgi:hypothetical protein